MQRPASFRTEASRHSSLFQIMKHVAIISSASTFLFSDSCTNLVSETWKKTKNTSAFEYRMLKALLTAGCQHRFFSGHNLGEWMNRIHGQLNFYLTQMVSDHDCFNKYLHHIDKTEDVFAFVRIIIKRKIDILP